MPPHHSLSPSHNQNPNPNSFSPTISMLQPPPPTPAVTATPTVAAAYRNVATRNFGNAYATTHIFSHQLSFSRLFLFFILKPPPLLHHRKTQRHRCCTSRLATASSSLRLPQPQPCITIGPATPAPLLTSHRVSIAPPSSFMPLLPPWQHHPRSRACLCRARNSPKPRP